MSLANDILLGLRAAFLGLLFLTLSLRLALCLSVCLSVLKHNHVVANQHVYAA